jgi:hypothetical protein
LLIALTCAGATTAGMPGRWDVVVRGGGVPGNSASDLGVARTRDGVLHVAWKERTGPLTEAIRHSSITAAGRLGPTSPIVSGWSGAGDPELVVESGGGLRVYFGGQHSTDSSDPLFGLLTATSPASGASWSAPTVIHNRNQAYARTLSATGGTPFQTWYGVSEIYLHNGLTAGTPDQLFTAGAALNEFGPSVVRDAAGRLWVGWCGFAQNAGGLFVQGANPASGAPIGAARKLPGSTTTFQGSQISTCNLERTVARRTPMVARVGGGVFIAGSAGYPTLSRVLVWRISPAGVIPAGSFAVAVDATFGHLTPALAAAPDGRIWVAWIEQAPGRPVIAARRSNRLGTVFGAPVRVRAPGNWAVGAINLSAQATRLDVLGLLATVSNDHSIQHTQLLPGLTLRLVRTVRRPAGGAAVTFRVLDAGDPVGGARVSADGRSAVTAGNGLATLVLTPPTPRSLRATAARAGYVGASVGFRCC